MATQFKNKVIKEVGPVPILALETDASTKSTIIGVNLANLTDFIVYASILLHDDTSVEGYFMKDVMVAPNSSFKGMLGGEKLIIPANNSLLVQSNLADSCDAIISYVDIV